MAQTIYRGTKDEPVQLDHFQTIVDFNWSHFAIFQVDFPGDLEYDFSVDITRSVDADGHDKSYAAESQITKKGKDKDLAIIEVKFDEPNPISDDTEQHGFAYADLFGELEPLLILPSVEVIDPVERWRIEDQARWDTTINFLNDQERTAYARNVAEAPAFQQGIIDAFLVGHPRAEILRDVTDLRPIFPNTDWTDQSHVWFPAPWFSNGSNNLSDDTGRGPPITQTATWPGYMTYHFALAGIYSWLEPFLSGQCFAKYPVFSDEPIYRECFIINLTKLGEKTIDIVLNARTSHSNNEVKFQYIFGTGIYTAKAKRIIKPAGPDPLVTKVKTAAGNQPLGTIIARFNKNGFVDNP